METDGRSEGGTDMEKDSGALDFTAAFALGALFGAGLALVLAPEKGEKTRKKLEKQGRRWSKTAKSRLEDAGERARETGGEWYEEAEGRVSDLSREIARAVEDGLATIRDAVSEEMSDLEKRLGRRRKKGFFRS